MFVKRLYFRVCNLVVNKIVIDKHSILQDFCNDSCVWYENKSNKRTYTALIKVNKCQVSCAGFAD